MTVVNLAEELLHVGRWGRLVKKTPEEIADDNARTNEQLCCWLRWI